MASEGLTDWMKLIVKQKVERRFWSNSSSASTMRYSKSSGKGGGRSSATVRI
jgi:hypothetical protein